MRESLLYGVAGDLVEDDALIARIITPDRLAKVPGNRLPLTIEVGRKIHGIGLGRMFPEVTDDFLLARQDLVMRLPVILGIDPHAPHQLLSGFLLAVLGLFLG